MKLPRFAKVKSRKGSGEMIDVIVTMTTKEKTIEPLLSNNISFLWSECAWIDFSRSCADKNDQKALSTLL